MHERTPEIDPQTLDRDDVMRVLIRRWVDALTVARARVPQDEYQQAYGALRALEDVAEALLGLDPTGMEFNQLVRAEEYRRWSEE